MRIGIFLACGSAFYTLNHLERSVDFQLHFARAMQSQELIGIRSASNPHREIYRQHGFRLIINGARALLGWQLLRRGGISKRSVLIPLCLAGLRQLSCLARDLTSTHRPLLHRIEGWNDVYLRPLEAALELSICLQRAGKSLGRLEKQLLGLAYLTGACVAYQRQQRDYQAEYSLCDGNREASGLSRLLAKLSSPSGLPASEEAVLCRRHYGAMRGRISRRLRNSIDAGFERSSQIHHSLGKQAISLRKI